MVSSRFSFLIGSFIFCVKSVGGLAGAVATDLALKAKLNLDSCLGEASDSGLEGGGIFASFSL